MTLPPESLTESAFSVLIWKEGFRVDLGYEIGY